MGFSLTVFIPILPFAPSGLFSKLETAHVSFSNQLHLFKIHRNCSDYFTHCNIYVHVYVGVARKRIFHCDFVDTVLSVTFASMGLLFRSHAHCRAFFKSFSRALLQ